MFELFFFSVSCLNPSENELQEELFHLSMKNHVGGPSLMLALKLHSQHHTCCIGQIWKLTDAMRRTKVADTHSHSA